MPAPTAELLTPSPVPPERSIAATTFLNSLMPAASIVGKAYGEAAGSLNLPPFVVPLNNIRPILILPNNCGALPIAVAAVYKPHCSKPATLPWLLLGTAKPGHVKEVSPFQAPAL